MALFVLHVAALLVLFAFCSTIDVEARNVPGSSFAAPGQNATYDYIVVEQNANNTSSAATCRTKRAMA